MNGPIISFDVSKGKSHMQGFLDHGKPLGKPVAIEHNKDGFLQIDSLRDKIKKETGIDPAAIYEYTGVYSNTLKSYLKSIGMKIYGISPLESAKVRKSMIRPTKNDSLDCRTIAEVYYLREATEPRNDKEVYVTLREMGRFYHYLLSIKIVEKGRYHRCLDDVWPCFDEVVNSSADMTLGIIKHYKNPSSIKSQNDVQEFLNLNAGLGQSKNEDLAKKIYDYSTNHVSGASLKSFRNTEIMMMASRVQKLKKDSKLIMKKMLKIASDLPDFKVIKTVPGMGDVTAVRILAEIGDINSYKDYKALIAYAGLDPIVLQSGQVTGEHLSITKKGSPYLRTILYVAVVNMIMAHKDNKITRFVFEKKNSGLSYKAAVVAGCSKLLKILYFMLRDGTCYSK